MQIAILDNDCSRTDLAREVLENAGHACRQFQTGPELLVHLDRNDCDMLIMDWQAVGVKGVEILHAVRDKLSPNMPILFLTSRSREEDIITAMAAGANDYIIKPIRRGELLTRVQALLKRAYPAQGAVEAIHFDAYTFDTGSSRITKDGTAVMVTQKEFAMALLFFHNLGRPLSRAYIQEAIWPRDADLPSRTMDTHVSRVRSKLELRPENGFRLAPVYGYGYRLEQLPR
jgi:DNA-binding response OmpR family regulator